MAAMSGICELLQGILVAHRRNLPGKGADHFRGCAANFHAFGAATLARGDSNSRKREFQTRGEQFAQGLVGAVIDRRRGEANFQAILVFAGDLIAAGAGLDANRERQCAVFFGDFQGLPSSFSLKLFAKLSRAENLCLRRFMIFVVLSFRRRIWVPAQKKTAGGTPAPQEIARVSK